ncbi:MAG: hypothetical protein AUH43_12830 [Acidobacteria bacterium 13_1_40CM_65_14]|nr:MAG: hypothetical protein AUH43_12830 [Acidobacteria bacterium 13_1_40CM_65_14]OLC83237.1 MAG: hypothetical protein AUH72_04870 [Acidobacteria bacterium 13_1_40CM_4_65_8]OLD21588.1 MAG: hypothetical protein AUJ01_01885 [Acidobacteria bacterium 13_1_40CM_3_65_5]OLE82688.1 MAG: hypothetical protein AUF76_08480 [Acidobacteria bacterium 13_1_20CM_2_65_9]
MAKTKKQRVAEARDHLSRAQQQCDQAATDAWEPAEPADCVTKCFYAFENAVVAAAVGVGIAWTKNHVEKARLAKRLFDENKVRTDVSSNLTWLNPVRKDISYGEPGEELANVDLEDLVSDLEAFINEVEELLVSIEEG